jgi:hypothetical protein
MDKRYWLMEAKVSKAIESIKHFSFEELRVALEGNTQMTKHLILN